MNSKFLILLILSFYLTSIHAQDSVIQKTSSIQFPFNITFKKLEEITNQTLLGEIYKDSLHTDNDNDQFKCTVWKNGTIKISSSQNNVLKIDVPLKVWVEKGIGTLGIYNYQSTTFQLIMSFQLVYFVTPDWKLKTKTIINGYTWVQKPTLEIAKVKISLTKVVENILEKKELEYASLIDNQMGKSIDLKKDIITVWNQLKVPQLISEEYNTWLRITPMQIESTPFVQDAFSIHSTLKINILSETFIGSILEKSPDVTTIPNLKYIRDIPNDFELYTSVNVPYTEATNIAKKKFLNQEFEFQNGKYKVNLVDIQIYSSNQKLMIEADLIGSYKGKVYIHGVPYYNDSNKMVRFKDLEFDMKTKNLLFKTFNWLFNGKIERKVQENFEIPTKEQMEESRQSCNAAFNQSKNGMKFLGTIYEMKPIDIKVSPNQLLLILLTKGNLKVIY